MPCPRQAEQQVLWVEVLVTTPASFFTGEAQRGGGLVGEARQHLPVSEHPRASRAVQRRQG
jgi:hypothetical protein